MNDPGCLMFGVGVGLMLIGLVCVFMTGVGPADWRRRFGRVGAACIVIGAVCAVSGVWLLPPRGFDY